MATHSSVLAWRIPGMGEPGGLPSMGSHRVGHDWSDLAAVAAAALTHKCAEMQYTWISWVQHACEDYMGWHGNMKYNWKPGACAAINTPRTHTLWRPGPASSAGASNSSVTWSPLPLHRISRNNSNVRWDWNSLELLGRQSEHNTPWLNSTLFLLALAIRLVLKIRTHCTLHLCLVLFPCPSLLLETCPAFVKNWGAPFFCPSTS